MGVVLLLAVGWWFSAAVHVESVPCRPGSMIYACTVTELPATLDRNAANLRRFGVGTVPAEVLP